MATWCGTTFDSKTHTHTHTHTSALIRMPANLHLLHILAGSRLTPLFASTSRSVRCSARTAGSPERRRASRTTRCGTASTRPTTRRMDGRCWQTRLTATHVIQLTMFGFRSFYMIAFHVEHNRVNWAPGFSDGRSRSQTARGSRCGRATVRRPADPHVGGHNFG